MEEGNKETTKSRLEALKAMINKTGDEHKENPESVLDETITHTQTQLTHSTPINLLNISKHYNADFTYEQQQFIDLFLPLKFNITDICAEVGINRKTYYDWMNKHEHFKEAIDHLREYLVDKAEAVLIQALDNADAKTAQFILKALDKRYKDKVDITSNGNTLGTIINIIQPNDETAND